MKYYIVKIFYINSETMVDATVRRTKMEAEAIKNQVNKDGFKIYGYPVYAEVEEKRYVD